MTSIKSNKSKTKKSRAEIVGNVAVTSLLMGAVFGQIFFAVRRGSAARFVDKVAKDAKEHMSRDAQMRRRVDKQRKTIREEIRRREEARKRQKARPYVGSAFGRGRGHYMRVLEIEQIRDAKELKLAYQKLALKWHPDRLNLKESQDVKKVKIYEEKFKEINEAYQSLRKGF